MAVHWLLSLLLWGFYYGGGGPGSLGTEPWSVAAMAALLSGRKSQVRELMLAIEPPSQTENPLPGSGSAESNRDSDLRPEVARSKAISMSLREKCFRLGYFHQGQDSQLSCGLELATKTHDQDETGFIRLTAREPPARPPVQNGQDLPKILLNHGYLISKQP